jgi:hypothetical protein
VKEQDRYLPPHQTWGLASHPTQLRGVKPVKATTPEILFPTFNYYLDESDPDIVILRRQDASFVAAFSARGVTKGGLIDAAKQDYRELVRIHRA